MQRSMPDPPHPSSEENTRSSEENGALQIRLARYQNFRATLYRSVPLYRLDVSRKDVGAVLESRAGVRVEDGGMVGGDGRRIGWEGLVPREQHPVQTALSVLLRGVGGEVVQGFQ